MCGRRIIHLRFYFVKLIVKHLTPAFIERIGVRLAALALLLLLVAPPISQTFAYHGRQFDQPAVTSVAPASFSSMPDCDMAEMPMAQSVTVYHHEQTINWVSCGYCDLLMHVPIILWLWWPFIWLLYFLQRVSAPEHPLFNLTSPPFLWSLSRAPPNSVTA